MARPRRTAWRVPLRPCASLLLVLTLWTPAHGKALWLAWELDLNGHAPPIAFVLTVVSTDAFTPPPLPLPWTRCTQVPGAQYCALIGCPPTGTYQIFVQAQYAEGLSDRSEVATCTIPVPSALCQCVRPGERPAPQEPPPAVVLPAVPVPPGPLVQLPDIPLAIPPDEETLSPITPTVTLLPEHPQDITLQPIGDIPTLREPEKPPPCTRFCEWLQ